MQDDSRQPEITVNDIDTSASNVKPSPSDVPVTIEELNAAFVRVTDENASLKEQNEQLKRKSETTGILNSLMVPSATKAFRYMFVYSGSVGVILLMNAFGCFKNPIPPSVMQVLVGSTAVTVIGLVGMVLTGVFVGARK